jgi:hypothetical protein
VARHLDLSSYAHDSWLLLAAGSSTEARRPCSRSAASICPGGGRALPCAESEAGPIEMLQRPLLTPGSKQEPLDRELAK